MKFILTCIFYFTLFSFGAETASATNTVSFISGANGSLSGELNQEIAENGLTSSVTATPNGGYYFSNWTVESGTYDGQANSSLATDNPLVVTNINDDLTLKANFLLDVNHTVTYNASPGGTVSMPSAIVKNGENAPLVTATPSPGYGFVSWSGDVTSSSKDLVITAVDSDKAVTANFQLVHTIYTGLGSPVEFPPPGGPYTENDEGSITPEFPEVFHGNDIELTITPDPGFLIDTITVGYGENAVDVPVTNPLLMTYTFTDVQEYKDIQVTFKSGMYTIYTGLGSPVEFPPPGGPYTENDEGSITPEFPEVFHGNDIELTITPDPGFLIDTITVGYGENAVDVPVTNPLLMTYTFTDVQEYKDIQVTFK
ncbi:MAG: hypothetical protein NE328_00105, partial [Lentisphaeraceae bacterium]|nr:hypothetical protein [Lentisphaeraceae bacterium]